MPCKAVGKMSDLPCLHGVRGWCTIALVGVAGVGATLIAFKVWRDNRKYTRSRKNWENLKEGKYTGSNDV